MLEVMNKESTWQPPKISQNDLIDIFNNNTNHNIRQGEHFIIFKMSPYIDSVYVSYDKDKISIIKRFTFAEGYDWGYKREKYFREHCLQNPQCNFGYDDIDKIFQIYSKTYPQWHLKRYHTQSLRVLDHIYNCFKQNTIKEMLYKSGLDELAQHVHEIDEVNLLSRKPSDIYDDISIRSLRALNCYDGALLLNEEKYRKVILDLQKYYPDIFNAAMNNAQCRYIKRLIDRKLTVGEIGRLYMSKRIALLMIWNKSQFEMFIQKETSRQITEERKSRIAELDPIYNDYFEKCGEDSWEDYAYYREMVAEIEYYLIAEKEDLNKQIRRSNRKRNQDWQERNYGYVVRYPQTINDFCREAIYMRNCLIDYIDAFVKNDTTILFMRKADAVNQPFITIEIFQNELKQAYRRFNGNCTQEEADWIKSYCERHGIDCGHFTFGEGEDDLF